MVHYLFLIQVMDRTQPVRLVLGQVSPTLSQHGAARWCVALG